MVERWPQGAASLKVMQVPSSLDGASFEALQKKAGLISRGREAQWRPARLEAAPLKTVTDWLQLYRRHWDESFDRLDGYLAELQRKKNEEVQK